MALVSAGLRRPDIGGVATGTVARQVLTWLGAPPPPSTSQYFEEISRRIPTMMRFASNTGPNARHRRRARHRMPGSRPCASIRSMDMSRQDLMPCKRPTCPPQSAHFLRRCASRPRNASVLGGLGLVKLRQEESAQARDLLGQASVLGDASQWKQARQRKLLGSCGQGAHRLQEDRLDDAAKLLEQALQIDAREPTAALNWGAPMWICSPRMRSAPTETFWRASPATFRPCKAWWGFWHPRTAVVRPGSHRQPEPRAARTHRRGAVCAPSAADAQAARRTAAAIWTAPAATSRTP